jgi:hypothetical protein
MRRLRVLLLYALPPESRTFSYQQGWPRHFARHRGFECVGIDLANRHAASRLRALTLARFGWHDAVVLLHSVFSNARFLGDRLTMALARAHRPIAYFIGNEYKLLPEKMAFCEALGISLLVTMNPDKRARALYRKRLGCHVVTIPSAAVDLEIFRPGSDLASRSIDIGYRGDESPLYLGHDERRRIADYFLEHAPPRGLRVDISTRTEDRLPTAAWARFLSECRAQLGSEAGGDYFELTDETRHRVNDHLRVCADADIDEIVARFFAAYGDAIPARMISSRHVEAAATKTVQILFEGRYSGYLKPDIHYIPLRKDFADFPEALRKLGDDAYCRDVTERAWGVATAELTYGKLIDRFHDALTGIL